MRVHCKSIIKHLMPDDKKVFWSDCLIKSLLKAQFKCCKQENAEDISSFVLFSIWDKRLTNDFLNLENG